jgi:hypothetical protein
MYFVIFAESFHTQEIIRRIVVVKKNVISDNFWLIYIGQKYSGGEDSSRLRREVLKSFIPNVHDESLPGLITAVTETFKQQIQIFMVPGCV